MHVGTFELIIAVITLALLAAAIGAFVWWLVVLVEALRIPDSQWAAADQNKLVHVVLMVVLGVVGTIIYVVVARPALRLGARPATG